MQNMGLKKLRNVGLAMIKFTLTFLLWFLTSVPALAAGTAVAVALGLKGIAAAVTAFAINMVISSVISKIFAPDPPSMPDAEPNPGAGQQLPPAGDNKLPVIYGTGYTGGIIIDTSITSDNHTIYWVFALSEVTNTENGGTGDNITFGNIYWGGKLCIFDSTDRTKVLRLKDESTDIEENISGFMNIYLYKNGSDAPANSSQSAISVMQNPNLIYKWDNDKRMTNTAFAIVRLQYSAKRNLTGLAQTRFQVINSRTNTGDCIYDYLTSARYGAAVLPENVDTESLDELTAYSNASINYIPWTGGTGSIPRFKFNGMIDTNQKIMNNIQSMADCCDCLVKYNEVDGKWGVIVQQPTYTVAMALNDSNIIGGITVSPVDLSNSFNYIEVKFPDGEAKDSFNSANFDLAEIAPELLFPNEPVNKQSVNLYLTNSDITSQLIANRMLKAAREDLQVQLEINFTGLQLEAGDIVTLTSLNYGWDEKLFRAIKVVQKFSDDGKITTALNLCEFNPAVYDDAEVTQFRPLDNTGLGDPSFFGAIPAPIITNILPNASNPAFSVIATTSLAGITQYAEIWYSAYQFPTDSQRIFAGITEVRATGEVYSTNTQMPAVQLFNVPAGNWYVFSRMVNSVATSDFSPASIVLQWRPMTFQYENRYLCIAYADDVAGGGFNLNPRNKSYFGLFNPTGNELPTVPTDPTAYKWYLADPLFGTNIFLAYISYQNRRFGFDTDFATYAGGTDEFGSGGAFVPTTTSKFDFRIWSALPDGTNIIDLDRSTGQTIITGMPSTSDGQISVRNTPDGQLVAELAQFLTFPDGGSTFTSSAATITVDKYGRVVGFSPPDDFFYTYDTFIATSGQTVFTPTARVSGYIAGQSLIFQNGVILDPSEYTETTTTFTLSVGATLNDVITCISMRAVAGSNTYSAINITVASSSTNTVVWNSASMPYELIDVGDVITFANSGTPTQYTVTGVNYGTRTITFSTNPTVSAGATIYKYRASGSSYRTFSRWDFNLTNANSYTPTEWAIHSAYEMVFLNGTIVNEQDYDISANSIVNMPAVATGKMSVIQFTENNLTTPTGSVSSVVTYTGAGATYSFNFNALAFNLYGNGCLFKPVTDYTTATNSYTFTTIPTVGSILVQQTFASVGAA
jgi:hypothetical protein